MNFNIRKGLDLKLSGVAEESIEMLAVPEYCHIHPTDFRWLKPRLLVAEGDAVNIGTPLFADKTDERIRIVSPVKGQVLEIIRGEKRVIKCVNIAVDRNAAITIPINIEESEDSLSLKSQLLQYGLWPCLRQRPFSVIPSPDAKPKAIFISCFDTAPLAPNMSFLMQGKEEYFTAGLQILQKAAGEGTPIHLCMKESQSFQPNSTTQNTYIHHFKGPHPAGNLGPQIHRIAPLDKGENVWYIHPLDVARIGRFFQNHILGFDTIFSLTGPMAYKPHYYSSIYGADLANVLRQQTAAIDEHKTSIESKAIDKDTAQAKTPIAPSCKCRIISGNILTGKQIENKPSLQFYDHQLTLLPEGGEREILGWLLPGFKKWSFSHTFTAWLRKRKIFNFNTSQHGDHRNFVMTDVYDKVFPYDNILPLELLKACLTSDIDKMEELGIYEVDDEDFALCEVVCPSKMPCQRIIMEGLRKVRGEIVN